MSLRSILDYVRYFILFEQDGDGLIKKIAGYHQFHGVREAVRVTSIASATEDGVTMREERATYGKEVVPGSKKAGVFWHTQGFNAPCCHMMYEGSRMAATTRCTERAGDLRIQMQGAALAHKLGRVAKLKAYVVAIIFGRDISRPSLFNIYNVSGVCRSWAILVCKRPAPPPSRTRWSKLRVSSASVTGMKALTSLLQRGTLLPAPSPRFSPEEESEWPRQCQTCRSWSR